MGSEAEPDVHLEQYLERAIAPYRGLLPEPVVAHMRELLTHAFKGHPLARSYLEDARPPANVLKSDEVLRAGVAPPVDPKKSETGGSK